MKIKVESERVVKAVNKLDGIEVVLQNQDDAREAIQLILKRIGVYKEGEPGKLEDVTVTSLQSYETSAVNYKMIFVLEFLFADDTPLEERVSTIKEIQEFFSKV